jgi:YihY family inner membrane protein
MSLTSESSAEGLRARRQRHVKAFLVKAYSENLTGLSAMVAYNLLLSIFPLALLSLFIASQVLQSEQLQTSVFEDLRRLFPSAAESTIVSALASIRSASTGLGLGALAASVWIGSSFWGALDTAFCQLYHVPCRSWVQQKRFALAMLVVVLVFFAATVAVPTIQSLLASGARDLPFGLSEVPGLLYLVSLGFGLVLLFLILCVIYWSVPNRFVPWRAVWPGATGATLAIAVIDYAFPFYLSNVSTLAGFGSAFTFFLIVLLWFYVLAFIILAGATVNAMRFEAHEAAR